ncbi:MAG: hypothetical protein EBV83_10030, partial [Verrucomicrobia bacterium]|nr:hypothetical protein [Verrucomicrobiota bacterium]
VGTATRTVNVLAPASTPPTVTSTNATAIGAVIATLSGNVVTEGSSGVTARGFLLSLVDTAPQRGAASVTEVMAGSGSGIFNEQASGLNPGSLYYFRAFAVNASGTSYGDSLTFTTLKGEPGQHPSDFSLGTISSTNIPVQWTPVGADGYLLMISDGALNNPGDGVPVANDFNVSDGSGAVNLGAGGGSYSSFIGFSTDKNYTFRLYPYNNSGGAIDYKTAQAPTLSASVQTTPQLFISGSLAALSTTYGSPSASTSFTVSGEYLTSTVSVAAPAGFEISTNNLTFSSSLTLSPESGALGGTTIHVRLAASAQAGGSFDGQTITVSGGGAATVTLATAAGNSVAPKSITVGRLMAAGKVYDGNTNASVIGTPSYEDLVNNESFAVTNNITWAFPSKNVGTNQSLVPSGNFTPPSSNYTISSQPNLTANISAKPLSVTGAGV